MFQFMIEKCSLAHVSVYDGKVLFITCFCLWWRNVLYITGVYCHRFCLWKRNIHHFASTHCHMVLLVIEKCALTHITNMPQSYCCFFDCTFQNHNLFVFVTTFQGREISLVSTSQASLHLLSFFLLAPSCVKTNNFL